MTKYNDPYEWYPTACLFSCPIHTLYQTLAISYHIVIIYIVYQLLALATTAVVFLGDAGAVAMLCTTLRLVQTEASPSE